MSNSMVVLLALYFISCLLRVIVKSKYFMSDWNVWRKINIILLILISIDYLFY